MANKKDEGFIKVFRDIEDTSLWDSCEPHNPRSAYIDLLLLANYKDKYLTLRTGKVIFIPRGTFHTSIESLAGRWMWSKNRVTRYLNRLERIGLISTNRNADGTTVTLVKYDVAGSTRYTDGDAHEDAHEDTREDGREDARGVRLKKDKKDIKKGEERKEERSAQNPPFSPKGKEYQ